MSKFDDLVGQLFRKLLADPSRAARATALPVIGRRIAEFARLHSKRPALIAIADARAAKRPDSRLTLEMYAQAAAMGGQPEFADWLYRRAARERKLSQAATANHIEVVRTLDPKAALELSAAAVKHYAGSGEIQLAHAANLWLTGNVEGAHRSAKKALKLAPDSAPAQHARDYYAYQLGKLGHPKHGLGSVLAERRSVKPEPGDIVVGILDYKAPDYAATSTNLGDHIQSLAILRHLARYVTEGWRFSREELGQLMGELKTTWGDAVPDTELKPAVSLLQLDRDYVDGEAAKHPDHTIWLPTFGWFMHPPFGARLPFPYPDNVRPIIISLHLNKAAHLTPEVIGYLKRYEPIGCRDWATCYWLRNVGVEAFFSGCVTLTLALPGERKPTQGLVVVDPTKRWLAANPGPHTTLTQVGGPVRNGKFVKLLLRAVERLRQFESAERISTSRLHCYLPSLALGVPVEFEPYKLTDRRFDGLYGLTPEAKDRIRNGIIEKLRVTLAAVFEGRSEAEVYAVWREACAADVAFAKAKLEAGKPAAPPADLVGVPSPAIVRSDVIDVAVSFDRKIFPQVPTILNSIDKTTTKKIRFHAQTRGLKPNQVEPLAKHFSRHEFNFIPMDGKLEDQKLHLIPHTTLATMDRLFLPNLLPDVDRIAYIDIDTIVLSDVEELYSYVPGPRGIAARNSISAGFRRQVNVMELVASSQTHEKAAEIRRIGARDVDLMAPAFNAGVLVLSLDRLRRLDFVSGALALVEQFGMNDQYALNIFSRGEYTALSWAWNAIPYQEPIEGAKLLHWAGQFKPWAPRPVRAQDLWKQYELPLDKLTGRNVKPKGGEKKLAA